MKDNNSVSIGITKEVSKEEMQSLSFTIEALTKGNPDTTLRFRLEKGLPIRWIKYIERLCENIPNAYSIQREPGLAQRWTADKYSLKNHKTQ